MRRQLWARYLLLGGGLSGLKYRRPSPFTSPSAQARSTGKPGRRGTSKKCRRDGDLIEPACVHLECQGRVATKPGVRQWRYRWGDDGALPDGRQTEFDFGGR